MEFFRNLLLNTVLRGNCLGVAIVEITLMLRLLLIPAFQGYYKSTLLADQLQDRIEKIYAKAKDPSIAAKKTSKLFVSVGYPSLGMITYLLFFGFFGYLMAEALHSPQLLSQIPGGSLGLFALLPDVTVSPYQSLVTGVKGLPMVICLLAPTLAALTTYFHDRIFTRHSAVQRETFDRIVLIAVSAAAALLPVGVSLYWASIELVGIGQSLFVRKFSHVQIKDKDL